MRQLSLVAAVLLGLGPFTWIARGDVTPGSPAQAAPESETKMAETPPAPDLPLPSRPYALRQGETLFRHYCSTCHGAIGRGDGFNAYSLDPKPRDLTTTEFQTSRTNEDLMAVIRTGGGAVGLSSAMPPWGRTLNERQMHQLVSFIRSLPRPDEETSETN